MTVTVFDIITAYPGRTALGLPIPQPDDSLDSYLLRAPAVTRIPLLSYCLTCLLDKSPQQAAQLCRTAAADLRAIAGRLTDEIEELEQASDAPASLIDVEFVIRLEGRDGNRRGSLRLLLPFLPPVGMRLGTDTGQQLNGVNYVLLLNRGSQLPCVIAECGTLKTIDANDQTRTRTCEELQAHVNKITGRTWSYSPTQ